MGGGGKELKLRVKIPVPTPPSVYNADYCNLATACLSVGVYYQRNIQPAESPFESVTCAILQLCLTVICYFSKVLCNKQCLI